MNYLLFVSLILLVVSESAFGCSYYKRATVRFDAAEFIFIGTVIGYTAPVEFDPVEANKALLPLDEASALRSGKRSFATHGLVVRVNEGIHLPVKSDVFEIFEYSVYPDCVVHGVSPDHFRNRFPLNSEVRVISKKAVLVPQYQKTGPVRLENRILEDGYIALNQDSNGNSMTSADVVFDYREYIFDREKDPHHKYSLPFFELRKDLFRLAQLDSQTSRNQILDRIVFAPFGNGNDYPGIFKYHTSNEAEYRRYLEAHLKVTDGHFFSRNRKFYDALDKLLKMGYLKYQAESALIMVLYKGTEVDARKLFEESLKILTAPKRQ